jgi:peptidoglycan/xylan/chitin deacetylase (PgdA/CDA1 family)
VTLIQAAMQKTSYFNYTITIPILFTIILSLVLLPALAYDDKQLAFANQTTITEHQINNNDKPTKGNSSSTTSKVVILNFYDDEKDQFTNAKPILDKYGFKVTFFIVCSWAGSNNTDRMTWQDISQLYKEGHDIESHTMTHKVLNSLSSANLDYEVGKSKQCLHDHLGVYPTVFSPPHGKGSM